MHQPTVVDYSVFSETIDTLYTRIGKRELLLCVDADSVANGWKVTRISIPPQTGDSVAVQEGTCAGHVGDLHNHPTNLGGLYAGATGEASNVDFASFRATASERFFSIWHGAGHWISYKKR